MKSSRLIGVSLLVAVLALPALAQDDAKLRNDPTYSVHNYKHPNKAAAAREWAPESSVVTRRRSQRRVNVGDYKRTTGRDVRTAGITLPAQSVPVQQRNYKAQNVKVRASKSAVATVPAKSEAAGGNQP